MQKLQANIYPKRISIMILLWFTWLSSAKKCAKLLRVMNIRHIEMYTKRLDWLAQSNQYLSSNRHFWDQTDGVCVSDYVILSDVNLESLAAFNQSRVNDVHIYDTTFICGAGSAIFMSWFIHTRNPCLCQSGGNIYMWHPCVVLGLYLGILLCREPIYAH